MFLLNNCTLYIGPWLFLPRRYSSNARLVCVNKIKQTSKFLKLKNEKDALFLNKIFIAYRVFDL
jgi:hypothetical protein